MREDARAAWQPFRNGEALDTISKAIGITDSHAWDVTDFEGEFYITLSIGQILACQQFFGPLGVWLLNDDREREVPALETFVHQINETKVDTEEMYFYWPEFPPDYLGDILTWSLWKLRELAKACSIDEDLLMLSIDQANRARSG